MAAALRQLCRGQLPEDLFQEVFLAVWRKAGTFDPLRGDVGGWLFTICRNKVYDQFRRSGPPEVELLEIDSPHFTPDRTLRLSLEAVVEDLRPGEQAALRMIYFGGFTYDQAAEQLEVPLGTLKSRLRSALRKLTQCLGGNVLKPSHAAQQPTMHPSADLIADYVAGQLHPYERWVVEAHLELCPLCRGLVADEASFGGAWLMAQGASSDSKPEDTQVGQTTREVSQLSAELWSRLEGRLREETVRPFWPEMPLPETVRREIEIAATDREWRRVGDSTSRVVRVQADPEEEMEFYLVRTPPGGGFPVASTPGW
ncbi:MAG: sigma-70 family RNA polymerase sigma factor [Thermoanaerobaculia bacterium]|nr:sigma-70 family RNA polymerase sigma factor [Thermoanaerobaculia bacterium]